MNTQQIIQKHSAKGVPQDSVAARMETLGGDLAGYARKATTTYHMPNGRAVKCEAAWCGRGETIVAILTNCVGPRMVDGEFRSDYVCDIEVRSSKIDAKEHAAKVREAQRLKKFLEGGE